MTTEITKRIKINEINNNFSLFAFSSGNISIAQHEVKKLSVGKWTQLNKSADTRTIEIEDKNGVYLQISLFRDREVSKW